MKDLEKYLLQIFKEYLRCELPILNQYEIVITNIKKELKNALVDDNLIQFDTLMLCFDDYIDIYGIELIKFVFKIFNQ